MPSWHIARIALIIFATKSIPLLAILCIFISFLHFWHKLIICKPVFSFILLAFRQKIVICMYMNPSAWLLHSNERNQQKYQLGVCFSSIYVTSCLMASVFFKRVNKTNDTGNIEFHIFYNTCIYLLTHLATITSILLMEDHVQMNVLHDCLHMHHSFHQ